MAYDDVIMDGVTIFYRTSERNANICLVSLIVAEMRIRVLCVNKFWEIEEDLLWKSIY